jgi:hypothetical protein
MKKIINLLAYPIKFVLKNKVKKYKLLLYHLREQYKQPICVSKARRKGFSNSILNMRINDMRLMFKYEKFINKWEL